MKLLEPSLKSRPKHRRAQAKRSLVWLLENLKAFDHKPLNQIHGADRFKSLSQELLLDLLRANPALAAQPKVEKQLHGLRKDVNRQVDKLGRQLANGPLSQKGDVQSRKRNLANLAVELKDLLKRPQQEKRAG